MGEPEGNRRRWPSGMLGALALIVAVESAVARHEMDFLTPVRLDCRHGRRSATERAPAYRVLGLGTSMTKQGLYPSVVERESGLSTYNLAIVAGRFPVAYFLLQRALASGARPEAIVLEVHPTYVAMPFQEGRFPWPDLIGPSEALDLAWATGDASFFASTVLARALPTLNAREEIRVAVQGWLGGRVGSTRSNTVPLLRHLEKNQGAFVRRMETVYGGEVAPLLEGMYLPPRWSPDKLNERYLRRVLDLCASRKIRVYWLIPPMAPPLQARREQLGHDGAYTRFTKRLQEAYPDLVVLNSRRSGYDLTAFSDAAHLNFEGAVTFSAEVGRILKTRPSRASEGSKWVDLPAYCVRATDAPLEEIAQSYRAVAESTTVKR